MGIELKRVYEEAGAGDGMRVLVDRLWPRGVSKASARIDLWLRAAAPSDGLRTWYGKDESKWDEFCDRYREELAASEGAAEFESSIGPVLERARTGGSGERVTLLYAKREGEPTHATVLREYLQGRLRGG